MALTKPKLVVLSAVLVAVVMAFAVFEVHTAFYDVEVDERIQTDGATVLARGAFHDVHHSGVRGEAVIYRMSDGTASLVLEGFRVDNGPALHVVLIDAADAKDNDTVSDAKQLDLGALKGNKGRQSYVLEGGYDPSFHAVSIWCERFSHNFATAPLVAVSAPSPSR